LPSLRPSTAPGSNSLDPADSATADAIAYAKSAGLHYVSDADPGIRRRRRGDAFEYVLPDGDILDDDTELARVRALAVPPAYEDVWICSDARGHLQATGRDARHRKQYRYHPEWRKVRDGAKFDRMIEFGEALPKLRRRLRRDLVLKGLPREKVLAVVVGLLDVTRVRVGNEEYARENASFGLTTLRNRHARFIRDGRLILQFRGKGGTPHDMQVDDRSLVRIVRRCQQLPGQKLFQYVDDAGERHPITSEQVNEYIRDATGAEFTAKDFRTWGATLHAISLLAHTPLPEEPSERALKACIVAAIKEVALELRNTPAVCRKSYINPVVFDAWRRGTLQLIVPIPPAKASRKGEERAIAFLRSEARRLAARGSARKRAGARGNGSRPPQPELRAGSPA